GDDDFGRCSALRARLRQRRLRHRLGLPRDAPGGEPAGGGAPRPPRGGAPPPPPPPGGRPGARATPRAGGGGAASATRPGARGRGEGAKGPLEARVLLATVQTKDEDGCAGPLERLAVLRSCEKQPRTWYTLSNARQARRRELAQVHGSRHRIEELLEEANQEVGLSHYEVRSWVGWHHHMALSLLALWFLQLERLRLGGKNAGGDGGAGAGGVHGAAPRAAPQSAADRRGREPSAAA